MVITKQIRAKILPNLPRDFSKQISEIAGCHPNTVTNVLHHEHNNYTVAEALINLAAIHKKKKSKQISKALKLDAKAKAA